MPRLAANSAPSRMPLFRIRRNVGPRRQLQPAGRNPAIAPAYVGPHGRACNSGCTPLQQTPWISQPSSPANFLPAPRGVGWVTCMPGWHKQRRPAMRALQSWCSLIGTRLRAKRRRVCSANFKTWGRSADSKSSTFCPHSKPPAPQILCFSMPGIQRRRATPSLREPLRNNFNPGVRRRHQPPIPRARESHGWSRLAFPAGFRSPCPGAEAFACVFRSASNRRLRSFGFA